MRHPDQSRNRLVLVEQIWAYVRYRDLSEQGTGDAIGEPLALAYGRGVREDQRREFTSVLSKARTGDASLQADAKTTEIRRRSRLSPHPFQPRSSSLQTIKFQAEPCRRSRRAARRLRSLTD
jgi:hypothetical protein